MDAIDGDVQHNARVKHAKARMSLVPMDSVLAVAHVLTKGAAKYAPHSWQKAPFCRDDYLDAMLRHLARIGAGEARDTESGQLHAAHVACNALMYLWYALREQPEGTEV